MIDLEHFDVDTLKIPINNNKNKSCLLQHKPKTIAIWQDLQKEDYDCLDIMCVVTSFVLFLSYSMEKPPGDIVSSIAEYINQEIMGDKHE